MRHLTWGAKGIFIAVFAVGAAFVVAGCSAETNPATDVTPFSATLNGTLTWQNNEGPGEVWWEYSKDNGANWTATAHAAFGKLPCSDSSGTCTAPTSKNITGLTPGSHYIFRLAGWTTLNGSATGTVYGDSNWRRSGDNDPPYEYDSFDTPAVQLTASGPLVDSDPSALVSPDSNLNLTVKSTGLARIELLLDGSVDQTIPVADALADWATESCSAGACTFHYVVAAGVAEGAPPGAHTFAVRAVDQSGRTDTISRSVSLDNKAPAVDLSGALAAADGTQLASQSADLTITATDGSQSSDSGISSLAVTVNGINAKTKDFGCASPNCPASGTDTFTFNKADWGPGPYEIIVTAEDGVRNGASDELLVDPTLASVQPPCPGTQPTNVSPVDPITAQQAATSLQSRVPGAAAASQPAPPSVDPNGLIDPTLQPASGSGPITVGGTYQGGQVPSQAAGAFSVAEAACLRASQSTSAETAPTLTSGNDAAVYANTAPQTDTLVRPTALGTTVVENFRGSQAPLSLSWNLALRAGYAIQSLSDGGLAVVDPNGLDFPATSGAPANPAGVNDPSKIADVSTQLGSAVHSLAVANNELTGEIKAVVPRPYAVNSDGSTTAATLSVSGTRITATRPTGTIALVLPSFSSLDPAAMCANAFASRPRFYAAGCLNPADTRRDDGSEINGDFRGFDWAPNGRLFVDHYDDSVVTSIQAGPDPAPPASWRIYSVDPSTGDATFVSGDPGHQTLDPQVSADGSRVVFERCDSNWKSCGIYTMALDGSNVQFVTSTYTKFHPVQRGYFAGASPTFSPDGQKIYFFYAPDEDVPSSSTPQFATQLYVVNRDGTGRRRMTNLNPTPSQGVTGDVGIFPHGPPAVSPGGATVAFSSSAYFGGGTGAIDAIYTLPSSSSDAPRSALHPVTDVSPGASVTHLWPSYSPDGSKLLHVGGGYNGDSLMTVRPDGTNQTVLARIHQPSDTFFYLADDPQYSPDGSKIAFMDRRGDPSSETKLYVRNANGSNERVITLFDEPPADGPDTDRLGDAYFSDSAVASTFASTVQRLSQAPRGRAVTPAASDRDKEWCSGENNDDDSDNYSHVVACGYFYYDLKRAVAVEDALFNIAGRDNNKSNAFRHGYWISIMINSDVDDQLAWEFALNHEIDQFNSPMREQRYKSQMDILNDFVAYKYAIIKTPDDKSDLTTCYDMQDLVPDAIFIGRKVKPYKWSADHAFAANNLIYRTRYVNHQRVRLNGTDCATALYIAGPDAP